MTVERGTNPHVYAGLAADSKPTTDVPAGSVFYVSDSGEKWVFDGQATWVKRIYPTT